MTDQLTAAELRKSIPNRGRKLHIRPHRERAALCGFRTTGGPSHWLEVYDDANHPCCGECLRKLQELGIKAEDVKSALGVKKGGR